MTPGTRFTSVLMAVFLSLPLSPQSLADSDHERARAALESGEYCRCRRSLRRSNRSIPDRSSRWNWIVTMICGSMRSSWCEPTVSLSRSSSTPAMAGFLLSKGVISNPAPDSWGRIDARPWWWKTILFCPSN